MKLMETRGDRQSTDAGTAERRPLLYPVPAPVDRLPSSLNNGPTLSSPVSASASADDDTTARLRHLLNPFHHYPRQLMEAADAAEAWQLATGYSVTAKPLSWASWRPPLTPLSPPAQVLALCRAQFWTNFVSSLFSAADFTTAAASTCTRVELSSDHRPDAAPARAPVTDAGVGLYFEGDQPRSSPSNVASAGGIAPLDAAGGSTSTTSTTANTSRETTPASAFDVARRLLGPEKVREYRHRFCAEGAGEFGLRQAHSGVCRDGPRGRQAPTKSELAADAADISDRSQKLGHRFVEADTGHGSGEQQMGVCLHTVQDHFRLPCIGGYGHFLNVRPTVEENAAAAAAAGGRGFSCRVCFKRYATPAATKVHSRTHTLPCWCAVCGKSFSRRWLLRGHLRTHSGERPFVCPLCRRAFADRSNLRAHLQTHAAVKKYACRRCDKTFSRLSLLAKHVDGPACRGLAPTSPLPHS